MEEQADLFLPGRWGVQVHVKSAKERHEHLDLVSVFFSVLFTMFSAGAVLGHRYRQNTRLQNDKGSG